MLDAQGIIQLYENVLSVDMDRYYISERAIKYAIDCMTQVYKPKTNGLETERTVIADYTDPAHRCAYLHKYAAFHTIMVRDMLYAAIQENYNYFYQLIYSGEPFRVCSLGGGPGTDIIGALAALHASFSYFETSATVIDYMVDWSYSFGSILRELGTGIYGAFGNNISHFLNWRYVGANLLKSFKPDTIEALSSASLVTMVKFASAAACQDTKSMIKNIFAAMRPGATLLFIDNDGGGFHNIMMEAAIEFDFVAIHGPFRREQYTNELMRIRRFGVQSCCKSTLTVHVLQKPFPPNVPLPLPWLYHERPSLLGSPPTPMLYRPLPFEENGQVNYYHERPILGSPPTPMLYRPLPFEENGQVNYYHERPILGSPPTPMLYRPLPFEENSSPVNYHERPILRSPPFTPVPVVNSVWVPMVATPESMTQKRRQGCLPLRIKQFRHHMASKINKVKSRAKLLFKKKNSHPIVKL